MRRALRRVSLCLLALFLFAAAQMTAVAYPFGGRSNPQVASAFPAKLTVGVLADSWLPFDALQNGEITGMSVDYLRALVGPSVVIEAKAFPDVPQMLALLSAGRRSNLRLISRAPGQVRVCVALRRL